MPPSPRVSSRASKPRTRSDQHRSALRPWLRVLYLWSFGVGKARDALLDVSLSPICETLERSLAHCWAESMVVFAFNHCCLIVMLVGVRGFLATCVSANHPFSPLPCNGLHLGNITQSAFASLSKMSILVSYSDATAVRCWLPYPGPGNLETLSGARPWPYRSSGPMFKLPLDMGISRSGAFFSRDRPSRAFPLASKALVPLVTFWLGAGSTVSRDPCPIDSEPKVEAFRAVSFLVTAIVYGWKGAGLGAGPVSKFAEIGVLEGHGGVSSSRPKWQKPGGPLVACLHWIWIQKFGCQWGLPTSTNHQATRQFVAS